jgi:hypothetical protein
MAKLPQPTDGHQPAEDLVKLARLVKLGAGEVGTERQKAVQQRLRRTAALSVPN